ncbi:Transmembrane protease serine 2 [Galemys pyrenaicus]|uniref:Transmembrane protease serine 2 n=1 Tax=Galemys pyrenaicus TaxID=202257 RepID=A0A8J6ABJ6_GALPY|nr:Transmembrane protease serine 2 [Galemys pyrenaicus]
MSVRLLTSRRPQLQAVWKIKAEPPRERPGPGRSWHRVTGGASPPGFKPYYENHGYQPESLGPPGPPAPHLGGTYYPSVPPEYSPRVLTQLSTPAVTLRQPKSAPGTACTSSRPPALAASALSPAVRFSGVLLKPQGVQEHAGPGAPPRSSRSSQSRWEPGVSWRQQRVGLARCSGFSMLDRPGGGGLGTEAVQLCFSLAAISSHRSSPFSSLLFLSSVEPCLPAHLLSGGARG